MKKMRCYNGDSDYGGDNSSGDDNNKCHYQMWKMRVF